MPAEEQSQPQNQTHSQTKPSSWRRHRRPASGHWRRPRPHRPAQVKGSEESSPGLPAAAAEASEQEETATNRNQTTDQSLQPAPEKESAAESVQEKATVQAEAEEKSQQKSGPGRSRPAHFFGRQRKFSGRRHADTQIRESPEELLAQYDFTTAMLYEHTPMVRQFTGNVSTGLKGLKFPAIDSRRARSLVVNFIREQVGQTGKSHVVVGVSGGVDSAVVAFLVLEALGRERVSFVHFIEMERSGTIRARADIITRGLRCHLEMDDLRPLLRTIFAAKQKLSPQARKRRINRERMAALLDLAEAKKALVIGSLNKTKLLLGFGTEYGDLAYDLNPVGDIYQSQILELARHLNIPASITDKLKKGCAVAENSRNLDVGRMWKEIDYYLYQIVDARISLSYLHELGLEEEKLLWLYRQIRDSAYKRVLPPSVECLAAYIPRSGEL